MKAVAVAKEFLREDEDAYPDGIPMTDEGIFMLLSSAVLDADKTIKFYKSFGNEVGLFDSWLSKYSLEEHTK